MNRVFPFSVFLMTLSILGLASHAAVVADYQFNTLDDQEGWSDRGVGSGNTGLRADGQSLVAVSPGLDPQLMSETVLTRAADASWESVTFRVRETETPGGPAIAFDPTGTVVQINNGGRDGLIVSKPVDFVIEESGDGFTTVTVSIAKYAGETIDRLRIDPIGGSIKNSNSDTAGNTYEIDFIQIADSSPADSVEPG